MMRYIVNLLVSIDQLGNVIAGGNPDNTISSRVGYYTQHSEIRSIPWYWRAFEWIINTTFYPIDGPDHCHEAFHNDAGEMFDQKTSNIIIAFLVVIIIVPSCVVIATILYILYLFGIVSPKKIDRNKNIQKRLIYAEAKLNGTLHELNEHKVDVNEELLERLSDVRDTFEEVEQKLIGMMKLIKKVERRRGGKE